MTANEICIMCLLALVGVRTVLLHITVHVWPRGERVLLVLGPDPRKKSCKYKKEFCVLHYVSKKTSPMFLAITRESIIGFS